MKHIFITILIILIGLSGICQITKGNWIIGGDGYLSTSTFSANSSKDASIDLSPNVGWFIANKMSVGLKGDLHFIKFKSNEYGQLNQTKNTSYLIGPFVRYYLLPNENTLNIITESSLQFGSQISNYNSVRHSGPSRTIFSIAAGPTIFFNNSVGLEILTGYKTLSESGNTRRTIFLNLGIQFYLEKDN